jgi:hypothetical protein
LRLVATHPDRLGGLGFLSLVPYAFAPLAVAHGALLASWIANRIVLHEAALLDFKIEIIALTVIMCGIVFGPLLSFGPRLAEAWRKGEEDYGPLASRYAAAFEAKWLGAERPVDDALRGTNDVQGLADVGRVYGVVQGMRFAPVTRPALVQLLIATLAPLVPLVFTMMPLAELMRRLTQLVF